RSGFRCLLYVASDGEENGEASIKNRIDNIRDEKHRLPNQLDNDGIEIVFCGIAATAGHIVDPSGREIRKIPPRDPGREDRLRQTWLSLFTRPNLVRFEPYCPAPTRMPKAGSVRAENASSHASLVDAKGR